MSQHHTLRLRRLKHVGILPPSPTAKRFFCLFYQWARGGAGPTRLDPVRINSPTTATTKCALLRRTTSSSAILQHHGTIPSQQDKPNIHRSIHSTTRSLQNASAPAAAPVPNRHTPGGLESVEDPTPLSHQIRLIMRHVPHSVVVITSVLPATFTFAQACAGAHPPPSSSYRGMTVSSFNTVALAPTPTVCFNIRTPSATLSAIQHSGWFLVHILDASPTGAKVADAFTRGMGATAFENPAFEVHREEGGMPLLVSRGVRRVLRCRSLGQGVVVGDHVIVLGEVIGIEEMEKDGEESGYGLVYVNRSYRQVGSEIPVQDG